MWPKRESTFQQRSHRVRICRDPWKRRNEREPYKSLFMAPQLEASQNHICSKLHLGEKLRMLGKIELLTMVRSSRLNLGLWPWRNWSLGWFPDMWFVLTTGSFRNSNWGIIGLQRLILNSARQWICLSFWMFHRTNSWVWVSLWTDWRIWQRFNCHTILWKISRIQFSNFQD